jgi:hypothetical protein
MPSNLSPELLELLRQSQGTGGSGWVNPFGMVQDGTQYQPLFNTSGAQGEAAATPSLMNYISHAEGQNAVDQPYQEYGTDGTWQREGKFQEVNDAELMLMMALATGGMMMLPGGLLSGTFAGLGGAAGGAAEAGAAAAGGSTAGSASAGAGFIGEGAASGIASWDAALAAAPSWSAGGAAGTTGAAFNAARDSQLANAAIEAGGGNALSGYTAAGVPSVTVNGAPTGSWLDAARGLLPSGVGSLLGPAATLLGAAAGSQGTEGQTQERRMDPRLDPYVFGDGGLLNLTRDQLQRSQSQQARAGWDQISNQGLGLLNISAAQNGFNRFFPGR